VQSFPLKGYGKVNIATEGALIPLTAHRHALDCSKPATLVSAIAEGTWWYHCMHHSTRIMIFCVFPFHCLTNSSVFRIMHCPQLHGWSACVVIVQLQAGKSQLWRTFILP